MSTIPRDVLERETRRQIMDIDDPKIQDALFSLLALIHQVGEELPRKTPQ